MIVFSVKNKTIYHRQENDFKLANRIIIKKGILGNNILKFITRLIRQLKYKLGYTLKSLKIMKVKLNKICILLENLVIKSK